MEAKELIRAGKLSEARKLLTEEVRKLPGDLSKRTLLFQVLAFSGEWGKAQNHLDIIANQDSKKETGVQVFTNLLQAEKQRGEVLKLRQRPSFLPSSPVYAEEYFAAREKLEKKRIREAGELLAKIDAGQPIVSGTLEGTAFAGFKDTDSFLWRFLEAMVYERYVWIPFESISELVIDPPKTLFDLLWIPARIATWEGLNINCYVPVLYPDSFLHEDDRVKLGRMTAWVSRGGPFTQGFGRHVFQIGEEEKSILEIREVRFKLSGSEGKHEKND
jgi:type VI secretion system protein ImpE